MSGINTLEDSLNYFKLRPLLQNLDNSLENVRRHRNTVEQHEECVRVADKDMLKLSLSYHPDKISNRGCSRNAQLLAEELQAALNVTRTMLSTISKEFLEELHIQYKYEFFTDLKLNSLGNENQIQRKMMEVSDKIRILSEIKQENIMTPIKKFLTYSRRCIENYKNCDVDHFEENHNLAIFYLKKCIEGHKKQHSELINIEKKCINEGLGNMRQSIKIMAQKSMIQLRIFETLRERKSLDEAIGIFRNFNIIDEFYVLPFAYYVNILLMCSLVLRKKVHKLGKIAKKFAINIKFSQVSKSSPARNRIVHAIDKTTKENELLNYAYYFASFVENDRRYQEQVKKLVGIENTEISADHAIQKFNMILLEIEDLLSEKFKIDFYNVFTAKEILMRKLTKINSREVSEYEELSDKLSKHMENCRRDEEEEEKERQKIMEGNEKIRQKLVQCSMLLDEVPKTNRTDTCAKAEE